MKVHPIFYTSLLKIYREFNIPRRIQPPPPSIEVDDYQKYEVEDILDSRIWQGQLEYFIHWRGYLISERPWEPTSNLTNASLKI